MQPLTNKYVLTSASFVGEVTLGYDVATGYLRTLSIDADLEPQRHHTLLDILPLHVNNIHLIKGKGITVTQIKAEVTFDMFWDAYDNKVDKETSARRWGSLSPKERIDAYNYIKVYDNDLRKGTVAKLYPSTYLSKKRWNDKK